MRVYLVRHGRAEESRSGLRDEDRALTERGRRELRETWARTRNVSPARILASPLRRARETALLLAEATGCPETPVAAPTLVPDSTPERVWAGLADHGDTAELMLVGHQPLLGAVYAFLLGAPTLAIAVEPGSIGCLDLDRLTGPPRGELCWLVSPA